MTTGHPPVAAEPDRRPGAPRPPWATTLAGLSLLWLLATLSSVRHSIGASTEIDSLTVARAAVALPPVIAASLVAGVAVGLAAVALLAQRRRSLLGRAGLRYGVSTAAGLLLGAVVAAPIAFGYEDIPSLLVVCAAVVAAGGVGGLLAGAPYREVVAAGVLGTLGVFLVGFGFGVFDRDLLALFGAGETEASVLAANAWVAFLSSLVAGLVAGLLAYGYLRRYGNGPRWPAYLAAGAAAGVLVLLAEVVTRLGGAHLFRLVSSAAADRTYLQYLGAARLNRALIVLFVGALVAIFLLGRSLTGEEDDAAEPAPGTDPAEPAPGDEAATAAPGEEPASAAPEADARAGDEVRAGADDEEAWAEAAGGQSPGADRATQSGTS